MRFIAIALVLAAVAGCASAPKTDAFASCTPTTASSVVNGVELGFATTGQWKITGSIEYIWVWAHNLGNTDVTVPLSLTGPGGSALPDGWQVTFTKNELALKPAGTKVGTGQATTYPDWNHALIRLDLGADAKLGDFPIELHGGNAMTPANACVDALDNFVAAPHSAITAEVVGTFTEGGAGFWSGTFPTKLAENGAVTGFAWGLIGIQKGETEPVVVPAAFAYGYDNPDPGDKAQFNGKSLTFTVTLSAVGRPPR